MNLKLIVAMVSDENTDTVVEAAREAGATGATVLHSARGEGLYPEKTFLGLELTSQRDLVMFLVAEPIAREILETIARAARFDEEPGSGIAFQLGIEDAVGLKTQSRKILEEIEEAI